jgi:hypothetical protein
VRSRAAAAVENLQALNPLAKVHVESGETGLFPHRRQVQPRLGALVRASDQFHNHRIKQFDLICVTGMSLSYQRQVDTAVLPQARRPILCC